MRYVIGGIAIVAIAVVGFYTVDLDVDGDVELPTVKSNVKVDPGELPDYDIVKTKEGRLPSISGDVDVEDGSMPDVDVNVADVEVRSKDVTVEVPDVDVEMKKKSIEVPTVDVDLPEDE